MNAGFMIILIWEKQIVAKKSLPWLTPLFLLAEIFTQPYNKLD